MRIDSGTRRQHRVIRQRDAGRHERGIEIDVTATAIGLVGHTAHLQRPGHHLSAGSGPGLGRVIDGIFSFGQLQHQIPVQRRLLQALGHLFEQEVVAGLGALLGALGGGFLGCWLVERHRGMANKDALRAAFGATLGRFGGFIIKLGVGVTMLVLSIPAIWASA